MDLIKKKEETKRNPAEMSYSTAELSNLKYVKVLYTGLDNKLYSVNTEVKFIGDVLISLYFNHDASFSIECPQEVMLKFVTMDAMYIASARLQEIKKNDKKVYFSIIPPTKMVRQQKRKYSRVDILRNCVLVVNDEKGKCDTYMSKTVNLSASGILIHELETMFSDKFVEINASKYGCYHLLLFLEKDIALKLFARFVRHECVNGSHQYAFHFLNVKPKNIDLINKYVTAEQLNQLKAIQKKD